MILLYSWLSAIYWTPGPLNSNLIRTEKAVPTNPENKAKIKYNVPISLAFEDKNQRSVHKEILDFRTEILDQCVSLDSCSNMLQLYETLLAWIWAADKQRLHYTVLILQ